MNQSGISYSPALRGDRGVWLLSVPLYILWFFLFNDGVLPQIEMAFFHGAVPIATVVLKFLLLLVLALSMLTLKNASMPKQFLFFIVLFVLCLVVSSIYQIIFIYKPLSSTLYDIEASYFFILIVPMAFSIKNKINELLVQYSILTFGLASSILGIVQHFSGSAILPTVSLHGYYRVWAYGFFEQMRAFAFNSTPADLGQFLVFAAIIIMETRFIKNSMFNKVLKTIFLAVVLIGIFCTLTRAIYIYSALVLVTWFILSRWPHNRMILFLPLVYFVCGLGIILLAPLMHDLFLSFGSISSDRTLYIRLDEWRYWGAIILNNPYHLLFGPGVTQYHVIDYKGMIDNVYISIVLQSGLISFFSLVIVTSAAWSYSFKLFKSCPSPVRLAIICSMAAYPTLFLFELDLVKYFMLFMLVIVVSCKSTFRSFRTFRYSGAHASEMVIT